VHGGVAGAGGIGSRTAGHNRPAAAAPLRGVLSTRPCGPGPGYLAWQAPWHTRASSRRSGRGSGRRYCLVRHARTRCSAPVFLAAWAAGQPGRM